MSKCGVCAFQGDYNGYLNHKCSTGHKPTEVAHQDKLTGGRFSRQSQKALERGEAKKSDVQVITKKKK